VLKRRKSFKGPCGNVRLPFFQLLKFGIVVQFELNYQEGKTSVISSFCILYSI
jgi:hypothetical protein